MSKLSDDYEKVCKKIGYEFKNDHLLYQAFTRSSYSKQYGSESNEVLEFIGDKSLDLAIVKLFADEFGFFKSSSDYYNKDNDLDEFCIVANKNESDFTSIKQKIVSNNNLARSIDRMGLCKYMFLGDCDIQNNVISQEKVKADLFEAIVGAITLDCEWDFDTITDCLYQMLNLEKVLSNIDTTEERPDSFKSENAINVLKELAERNVCSIPEYFPSDEQVYQDGQYWWSCTCCVRSWGLQMTGLSTSKKGAKKYAAHLVLCKHYDIEPE